MAPAPLHAVCRRLRASAPAATTKVRRLNSGQPFTLALEERIIADLNDPRVPRRAVALRRRSAAPGQRAEHPKAGETGARRVPRQGYLAVDRLPAGGLDTQQIQVVDRINVLIDGKFVQDLKDPALIWRGSSNRVVHRLR